MRHPTTFIFKNPNDQTRMVLQALVDWEENHDLFYDLNHCSIERGACISLAVLDGHQQYGCFGYHLALTFSWFNYDVIVDCFTLTFYGDSHDYEILKAASVSWHRVKGCIEIIASTECEVIE